MADEVSFSVGVFSLVSSVSSFKIAFANGKRFLKCFTVFPQ